MLITQCKTGLNGLTTLKKYNRNFFASILCTSKHFKKNIIYIVINILPKNL